jgi:predicted transcriptional regulator
MSLFQSLSRTESEHKTAMSVGRYVKPVDGDVSALRKAGVLDRVADGRVGPSL